MSDDRSIVNYPLWLLSLHGNLLGLSPDRQYVIKLPFPQDPLFSAMKRAKNASMVSVAFTLLKPPPEPSTHDRALCLEFTDISLHGYIKASWSTRLEILLNSFPYHAVRICAKPSMVALKTSQMRPIRTDVHACNSDGTQQAMAPSNGLLQAIQRANMDQNLQIFSPMTTT